LYGTLFLALGKALPAEATLAAIADAFSTAIDSVKARGKSEIGQKTMLDVLTPVLAEVRQDGTDLAPRLRSRARRAAAETVPMRALKGRASFLGERSIGHMDPGARSSCVMVEAVADFMEGLA